MKKILILIGLFVLLAPVPVLAKGCDNPPQCSCVGCDRR